MKRFISAALVVAITGGCATASHNIPTQNISPMQYANWDCQQLNMESNRVQSRINELRSRIDTRSQNDTALTAVGLVLFWPALFFLGGNAGEESEYGRLIGEQQALTHTAFTKGCGG